MKSFRLVALSTLLTVGTFSAVLYTSTSCNKDECKDVVCNNGGTCNAGTCVCPTGVHGTNCGNIYRSEYKGVYVGNGISDTFHFNNFRMTFDTVSGGDLTKMSLSLADAAGGSVDVPVLPITVSGFSESGSVFTITSTSRTISGVTYTYTGTGTVSKTVATLSLVETPSTGSASTYVFTGMLRQ